VLIRSEVGGPNSGGGEITRLMGIRSGKNNVFLGGDKRRWDAKYSETEGCAKSNKGETKPSQGKSNSATATPWKKVE